MRERTSHSQKGIWLNLTSSISRRGSHREWKGHSEHATYIISFAFSTVNTGEPGAPYKRHDIKE